MKKDYEELYETLFIQTKEFAQKIKELETDLRTAHDRVEESRVKLGHAQRNARMNKLTMDKYETENVTASKYSAMIRERNELRNLLSDVADLTKNYASQEE